MREERAHPGSEIEFSRSSMTRPIDTRDRNETKTAEHFFGDIIIESRLSIVWHGCEPQIEPETARKRVTRRAMSTKDEKKKLKI